MKLTTFKVHKSWLIRVVLVLLATVVVDGVVVCFAQRPLLWATLIPGTLPLSMWFFVALPVLREEKRKSTTGTPEPGGLGFAEFPQILPPDDARPITLDYT